MKTKGIIEQIKAAESFIAIDELLTKAKGYAYMSKRTARRVQRAATRRKYEIA